MTDPTPQEPPNDRIPVADMEVIEEMQGGVAAGLGKVQMAKAMGRPVLWTTMLTPKEILYAMDVPMVFGDLVGAYAAIFGFSEKYCQVAEEAGLSRDVCAIHRCALGVAAAEDREGFFDMTFAEPSLAIGTNFPCVSESKSFLQVVDQYQIPYYFLDAPINTWGSRIPDDAIDYYAGQLQGMIDFLVEQGFTFDMDQLRQEVAFTRDLNRLLLEVETYKQAIPHPIRAYDNLIATMTPIALPKEMRTLDLFEQYRDALKQRVAEGFGVVEEEKLRLLWIGVPPLCEFKLLNYPERHGAVVVKSMVEYLTGFALDPDLMDPDDPLRSIAKATLMSPANPLYAAAIDYLAKSVEDYRIDGVISVVKRSCGLVPGMQRLTKEAIFERTGAPSIVFDLDGVDSREYDPVATKATIDSFVETLLERKGA